MSLLPISQNGYGDSIPAKMPFDAPLLEANIDFIKMGGTLKWSRFKLCCLIGERTCYWALF